MTFIDDMTTSGFCRVARHADGAINHDHYRIMARRRRDLDMRTALGRAAAWLRGLAAGPQHARATETDWRVQRARRA